MKKMKALAYMLIGFGLLFTACSDDDSSGAKGTGGSANVRISLYASDAIAVRSTYNSSSNLGGATNLVNTTSYYLRYILAVYGADGSEVVKEQHVVPVGTGATTFEVTLAEAEEYTAVGWCDFVTGSADDAADNHYDTTAFPEISCKDIAINDESYDAYYASQSFTAMNEVTQSISLKRPFAKLRIVANNWTTDNAPDAVSITYSGLTRYTTLNAKDGSVSGASSTATYSATTIPTYSESDGTTILVDYILVDDDAQSVSISYDATQNGTSVGSKTVAGVPLQRNYLTTVSGKVLNGSDDDDDGTVNGSGGIIVNGAWDGDYEVVID